MLHASMVEHHVLRMKHGIMKQMQEVSCQTSGALDAAGYGYFRAHIQSFDPGWKGAQIKGIEDEDTRDMGNDPIGVIKR